MSIQSPPVEAPALPEKAMASRLTTAQVYEALRRKILDHTIPPSTKVNIHHLSQEFGVSPTPVREALRLLQGDNLLVATSNKGYATTATLDQQGVRDLFEFRLLFEPWAAGVVAGNRLINPSRALREELQRFKDHPENIKHSLISHDNLFHTAILDAAGNQVVLTAFQQSHCHLHLFRMYNEDWDWRSTVSEHEEIEKAISAGKPAEAEGAMRDHLHAAYRRFRHASSDPAETSENPSIRRGDSPQLIDHTS